MYGFILFVIIVYKLMMREMEFYGELNRIKVFKLELFKNVIIILRYIIYYV